ncbi:MAG: TrkH family potassium uptake protein [Lachnospiraceae bacterium]|nr:TrkH family potassium uptake protein [Lachnospiraceae bacterium]
MIKKTTKRLTQTQFIAYGFLMIITLGALLLTLPISSRTGEFTSPLTALFTATSATCVTGLVVVDTYQHWSIFGQIVILLMIQSGGLGFMTIGVFFSIFLRRKIGLKERGLLQESVNTLQIGGIVKLVKMIVTGTLLFEIGGAILLTFRFATKMDFLSAIYYGIFHSVSAFCNAGFDLMGRYEEYSSLISYRDDIVVNLVVMILIIVGGIGFIVWDDVYKNKYHFNRYMLHTKIVLTTTFVLLFGAAILFYIFEKDNLLAGVGLKGSILASLFSAVTPRTAGFNTIDTAALDDSSMILTMILMFIGGSPGSTAGGIKTTTIFIMLMYVVANIRNTHGCNAFGRRFDDDAIRKASTVFMINLSLAIISAMVLCAIQTIKLDDAMFEVFSAIGTVGMSTGVTRELTSVSRIIIILLMYCGRIGSLSFALSFTQMKISAPVQLPIGKVTVG